MTKLDLQNYRREWYLKNRAKKLKQNADWARKNKARMKLLQRRWYEKNSAKHCLDTVQARKLRQAKETVEERSARRQEINKKQRQKYAQNKNKRKTLVENRFNQIKFKYGLTKEGFKALMTAQKGKCAICSAGLSLSCHIDHSHSTSKVRGLLCPGCNKGLGMFKDNVKSLRKAIKYLSKSCA